MMNHAALITALVPFAALAKGFADRPDSEEVLTSGEASITVGQLRQAQRIIESEGWIQASGALTQTDARWQQLAREGRDMEAIKVCRAEHGLGLSEARSVVERFLGRKTGMFRT